MDFYSRFRPKVRGAVVNDRYRCYSRARSRRDVDSKRFTLDVQDYGFRLAPTQFRVFSPPSLVTFPSLFLLGTNNRVKYS